MEQDSASDEADVLQAVYEAMASADLSEDQIINVVNAVHNNHVVFRFAEYLSDGEKT